MGREQRRSAAGPLKRGAARLGEPVRFPLRASLRGTLIRRYKRFFAEVETASGETLTVHCPDPGSMRGCAIPGAAVRCSRSDDPRRKLPHTLEMIRVGRAWVGVNTGRANAVVARVLERRLIPELSDHPFLEREVPTGRSRLDFRLHGHPRSPAVWLEVKSVTLADGSTGLFPDSVTVRGRRHLLTLARLARRGERAALLFLVQRADCQCVRPADAIDPAYGRALRSAERAGVELFALGARVTARGICVERRLPVLL